MTNYRNDIYAPWIQAQLWQLHSMALAKGQGEKAKKIAEEMRGFQAYLEGADANVVSEAHFIHHVWESDFDLQNHDARDPQCGHKEITYPEFRQIEKHDKTFRKKYKHTRRLMSQIFKERPKFYYLEDGQVHSYDWTDPFDVPHAPEKILVDFDGDNQFTGRGGDQVLSLQIFTDDPTAPYYWGRSYFEEEGFEGQRFSEILVNYRREQSEEAVEDVSAGEIAHLIEELPVHADAFTHTEVTFVNQWLSLKLQSEDDFEFRNAVTMLLLVVQKGHLDALVEHKAALTPENWARVAAEPLLASRIPLAIRTGAKRKGVPLLKVFDYASQNFEDSDVVMLVVASATVSEIKKAPHLYSDEEKKQFARKAVNIFEAHLEGDFREKPLGTLPLVFESLEAMAEAKLISDKPLSPGGPSGAEHVRDLVLQSLRRFEPYQREQAYGMARYQKKFTGQYEYPETVQNFFADAAIMGFNRSVYLQGFSVPYVLNGPESYEDLYDFLHEPIGLDLPFSERYSLYHMYNFSSMTLRYMSGDRNRLYQDKDLDIWNLVGRLMRILEGLIEKIEDSGNSQATNIVESWDSMDSSIALGRTVAYAAKMGQDWRTYLEEGALDTMTAAAIANTDLSAVMNGWDEASATYQRAMEDVTLPDMEAFAPHTKAIQEFQNDESQDFLYAKNIFALHLLRYAFAEEPESHWRDVSLEDAFAVSYRDDYDQDKMTEVVESLTPGDLKYLWELAEDNLELLKFSHFYEGVDQYRMTHYVFAPEVMRAKSHDVDLQRQDWSWAGSQKTRELFALIESGQFVPSEREVVTFLKGMRRSDFHHLRPHRVLEFAKPKYPERIQILAWEVYGDAGFPKELVTRKALEIYGGEFPSKAIEKAVKKAGNKWNQKLLPPRPDRLQAMKFKPGRFRWLGSRSAERQTARFLDAVLDPPLFHKYYRTRLRQLARRHGQEPAVEVLLGLSQVEREIDTDMPFVFGVVFDFKGWRERLIILAADIQDLEEDMDSAVAHADDGDKNSVPFEERLFTEVVFRWLETYNIDPYEFSSEFLYLFLKALEDGEPITEAEAIIQTAAKVTLRQDIVRGLKPFRGRALSEIGMAMDRLSLQIQDLEAKVEPLTSEQKIELQVFRAQRADLSELQLLVAFDE